MKLSLTDEKSLIALGVQASEMLARKEYSALASRFGYALCYGREPAEAIEDDHRQAMESPCREHKKQSITVTYFKPNSIPLFAAVECWVPVDNDAAVLLSLVVAGESEKHMTIEDIVGVVL